MKMTFKLNLISFTQWSWHLNWNRLGTVHTPSHLNLNLNWNRLHSMESTLPLFNEDKLCGRAIVSGAEKVNRDGKWGEKYINLKNQSAQQHKGRYSAKCRGGLQKGMCVCRVPLHWDGFPSSSMKIGSLSADWDKFPQKAVLKIF